MQCPVCSGLGRVVKVDETQTGKHGSAVVSYTTCPDCRGRGQLDEKTPPRELRFPKPS